MHIPDGFLSAPVAIGYGLVSLVAVAAACRSVRKHGEGRSTALLGVSAAFVFAAQLVNFPIGAGTSGHLVGATLAVALLGLPGALVVMTAVLLVQCLVFADGGVLALGANVFNMALVGCVVGYGCYLLACVGSPSATRRVAGAAFASWCSTVAAAASCAEQLALSGAARWPLLFHAMFGVHALIGLGEAVITALVLSTVLRFRPELLNGTRPGQRSQSPVRAGLGLSLGVAALLAPLACSAPDGLSRVAVGLGFRPLDGRALFAPFANYALPGLGSGWLSTVVVGCFGTLLLFGLCWLLALGLVPRSVRVGSGPRPMPVESSG